MPAERPELLDYSPSSDGGLATYKVEEHGLAEVPIKDLLDEDGRLRLNPDIESKGYFTVQLTKKGLRVRARGYIGLIPLNQRVAIDVVPRVPVAKLERLLRISQNSPDFLLSERVYATGNEPNESLLDIFAEALVARVEEIASKGMLRDYRRRTNETSFPRGRILGGLTTTRLHARGLTNKAASSWFERTADLPANRCLKYALLLVASRLSRLGRLGGNRRRLLIKAGALYEMFGEVELDHAKWFLGDPMVAGVQEPPPLRHYYRPALSIARLIAAQESVRLTGGGPSVSLPSMIIDMSKVFEDYLRTILRYAARREDWEYEVLDGNAEGKKPLFNQPPSADATPDIVVRDRDRPSRQLIIEVKNVPVKGAASERPAIEQVVTYGESYRCPCLVLAHPRASGQEFTGLRLQGEIGSLRLYQYVFDLAAASELEDARFAQAIHDLVQEQGSAEGLEA